MKNWLLPLTVLGVSSLGLMFASERGRAQLRSVTDRLATLKDPLGEFNQAVENELEHIQNTLNELSEALKA